MPRAVAGDNVGVLLRGVKREFVERGMYLGVPGQQFSEVHGDCLSGKKNKNVEEFYCC